MPLSKKKRYQRTKFTPEVIRDAISRLGPSSNIEARMLSVEDIQSITWDFDDQAECFAAYRNAATASAELNFHEIEGKGYLAISFYMGRSTVTVQKNTKSDVEHVFDAFEAGAEICRLPVDETEELLKKNLTVFLGHGRSPAWKDLKDHLHEQHHYKVTAYETGPRVGLHIADILESMQDEASFAILVMTAENQDDKGGLHARENVIHEIGLFQGRLGFKKAIVLLEHGCSEFSNLSGVQHIPFAKNNIRETFGDVLATIKREFTRDK